MTTVSEALSWVRDWEGYRDNAGAKVWQAYAPADYTGSSFCGAGQAMICKHFGLDLAPTTHQRLIYVPYVVQDAREAGKWILSKESKPGDWVIFAWGNGYHDIPASKADHIGIIVENDPTKSTVTTFEFNTTDGNGNGPRGAFTRTRSRGDIMGCVDRQHAYTVPPPPKPSPVTPNVPKAEPWYAGAKVAKAMQDKFKSGGVHDGSFDGQDAANEKFYPNFTCIRWTSNRAAIQPSPGVKAWQKAVGVKADGYLGQETAKATQRWAGLTGKDVDGYLGSKSVEAICNKLGIK